MTYWKDKKLTSKKITRSANGEACTMRIPGVCQYVKNGDTSTTVFCHISVFSPIKGTGNKTHDIHGYYACHACHQWQEFGYKEAGRSKTQVLVEMFRAMIETQHLLIQKNLITEP